MADLAQLQALHADALTALHSLMTGTRVVEVVKDGRRITYSGGRSGDLKAYVDDLAEQIAALRAAEVNPALPRRRFIPVGFR